MGLQETNERTILCLGTTDKLGSASREHALSSDRTDMGHSSSCRDVYMAPLARVMISLPYLVLLRRTLTTARPLYFSRRTHLIDELVLFLGIFEFIFCNGRLHVAQKGTGEWCLDGKAKDKGTRTDATRSGALSLDRFSRSLHTFVTPMMSASSNPHGVANLYYASNLWTRKGTRRTCIYDASHFAINFSRSNRGSSGSAITVG